MNHAHIQLFQGPGLPFESRTIPLPDALNPGEILVEISLATVCGSDLHTVSGRRGAPTPCVLGHEAIGRVVASERAGFSEGQRVTWTLADSCGKCPACTQWGLPQKCTHLFKYGHAALGDGSGLNGCYASHIILRAGTFVLPVPDSLPDTLVAPANCALATIVNALEEPLKESSLLRTALVQGGGLLGLYACAWLRYRGVERVFCTDLSDERLALVPEFGGIAIPANESMKKRILEESGGGVDLALEVAGSASVIPDGIALLRPGGTYVWAGMVHPQTALDLTGEAVLRKCLTIRGVHNYAPRHLTTGLEFLASQQDRLPFEKLVSPALPLAALDEALALTETRRWLRVSIAP
jgi:putative phosphonate catabolism associated alcohol dehydrogenase